MISVSVVRHVSEFWRSSQDSLIQKNNTGISSVVNPMSAWGISPEGNNLSRCGKTDERAGVQP